MKRHELKFYITLKEAELLQALIQSHKVLDHDDHYDEPGYRYRIRSLYFESHDRLSLWDKLGGFNLRKKIRLRIYDPPFKEKSSSLEGDDHSGIQGDPIKLEVKKKIGDLVDKDSSLIERTVADGLIRGDLSGIRRVLLDNDGRKRGQKALTQTFIAFSEEHFRPFVLVEYRRVAYKYRVNDLRITLDYDLISSKDVNGFFGKDLACAIPILPHELVIMEVKFNHFFPQHLSYLFSGTPKVRSAISKFVMCGYESDINTFVTGGGEPTHYELLRGKLS